jgi:type II secretory pathway component PulM
MIRWLDKLNLRPQEKRLVVIAMAALFVVLNLWLVWPHFKDLKMVQGDIARQEKTLRTYLDELAHTNEYQARLSQLEQQGTAVLPEERYNTLIATIQSKTRECGVNSRNITPVPKTARGKTNEFFEEQTLTVDLNPTGPEELIRFLESVADDELAIRVRELDLRPDPTQTRLQGSMKLVASFQKKPSTRPAVSPPPGGTPPKP